MLVTCSRTGVCCWAVLLFRNAIAAHALPRVVDLGENILRDSIPSADDADADSNGRAVPAQPAARRREHVWRV